MLLTSDLMASIMVDSCDFFSTPCLFSFFAQAHGKYRDSFFPKWTGKIFYWCQQQGPTRTFIYQSEYCFRFLKHQIDLCKEVLQIFFILSIFQVSVTVKSCLLNSAWCIFLFKVPE